MGPPVTRTAGKKIAQVFVTPASSQDTTENDVLPLDEGLMGDAINLEPQNATPRRNQRANQQQQPARRQVERPDLDDVLTQLTQEILTMRGEVANQPNQAPAVDVPEDPNFNCTLQKLPAETKFPFPWCSASPRISWPDFLPWRLVINMTPDFCLPSCRTGPISTTRYEILLFKD